MSFSLMFLVVNRLTLCVTLEKITSEQTLIKRKYTHMNNTLWSSGDYTGFILACISACRMYSVFCHAKGPLTYLG